MSSAIGAPHADHRSQVLGAGRRARAIPATYRDRRGSSHVPSDLAWQSRAECVVHTGRRLEVDAHLHRPLRRTPMSDAYDLTQFTVEPDWISETEAEDAARAEFLLIPTGTYEGQITAFETRDGQERGLYAGRPIIHCTRELYGVEGKTRQDWFDLSPALVHQ